MKVVAAYLLATLGGNQSPSADDIKNILKSVGASADDERITALLGELKGKSVQQVIEAGKTKLSSVPTGGASSGPAKKEDKKEEKVEKKEEKKVEKKPEPEPEEDGDMGMSLFGGDD
jgi:large subunit ribosomal protein LP2